MIAIIYTQCVDSDGITGCFLKREDNNEQITPTFKNLVELFNYCNLHFPDRVSISIGKEKINTIL